MIYKWYLVFFLNLIHTWFTEPRNGLQQGTLYNVAKKENADFCLSPSIIFNLLKYIRVNSLGVYCALNGKTSMGTCILYGGGGGVALPKHITSNHTKKNR